MSFLSRASLNYPPPPAPGHNTLRDEVKPLPSIPPLDNAPFRKLKRKPPPSASLYEEPRSVDTHQHGGQSDEAPTTIGHGTVEGTVEGSVEGGMKGAKGADSTDKSNIMKRMSSMFRSKRKAPPQSLPLNGRSARQPVATMYIAEESTRRDRSYDTEEESYDESEDDIRRPSGLGSAVSLEPPASPSFFQFIKTNSPPALRVNDNMNGSPGDESPPENGEIYRTRAASSPNLLRSISMKAKNTLRKGEKSPSIIQGTFQTLPTEPRQMPVPEPAPTRFPNEVLDLVLSHLPRSALPAICTVSRSFSSAGRSSLYSRLDLDTLRPLKLQKLLAMLASRPHLTELVQECVCTTWPDFFARSLHDGGASEDEEVQLRDHFLIATFTLALQRMANLTTLTLPAFNASLLAQHTAFGLRSLTFMSRKLSGEETAALFTWLNGQVNIVELRLPLLEDAPSSNEGLLKPPESVSPGSSPSLGTTPLSPFFSPESTSRALSPSPSYAALSMNQNLFGSPTLLPSLTTLHATPAILALLQPSSSTQNAPPQTDPRYSVMSSTSTTSNASTITPRAVRPLRKVTLNITTTLYTGLRPNTIMAGMKGGVKCLGVRFGENVDRRSVDKFLVAVSTTLGSGEMMENGEWGGLEELEVAFMKEGPVVPSLEEALYKTLQSTLPRYTSLRRLHLSFTSSRPRPFPPPSTSNSPMRPTTASSYSSYKSQLSLEMKVLKSDDGAGGDGGSIGFKSETFKFPAPPRVHKQQKKRAQAAALFDANGGAPPSAFQPPPVASVNGVAPGEGSGAVSSKVGEEEKRVEGWKSVCPSLKRVTVPGYVWQEEVEEVSKEKSAVNRSEGQPHGLGLGLPDSPGGPPANFGQPIMANGIATTNGDSFSPGHAPKSDSTATIPPPPPPKENSPIPSPSIQGGPPSESPVSVAEPPPPFQPQMISQAPPPPLPPSRSSSVLGIPFPKKRASPSPSPSSGNVSRTSSLNHSVVQNSEPPPSMEVAGGLKPPASRTSSGSSASLFPLPKRTNATPKTNGVSINGVQGSVKGKEPMRASSTSMSSRKDSVRSAVNGGGSLQTQEEGDDHEAQPGGPKDETPNGTDSTSPRKRMDSARVLALIRARDQRWTPKDLPDDELDDSSSSSEDEFSYLKPGRRNKLLKKGKHKGKKGSRKKDKIVTIQEVLATDPEVVLGLKPPPPPPPPGWVKPVPEVAQRRGDSAPLPLSPGLSRASVDDSAGLSPRSAAYGFADEQQRGAGGEHHRYIPSVSSRFATEGSQSVDYGSQFVSLGYGEGFPELMSPNSSIRSPQPNGGYDDDDDDDEVYAESSVHGRDTFSVRSESGKSVVANGVDGLSGGGDMESVHTESLIESDDDDADTGESGEMEMQWGQGLVDLQSAAGRGEFVLSRYIESDDDSDTGETDEESLGEIRMWESAQRVG